MEHNKDEENLLTEAQNYVNMLELTIHKAHEYLIIGNQSWKAIDILNKAIQEIKK